MYSAILVPHAGTPGGDEALKHAIHIAKSSSAKITILHVVEEISPPPMFALASSEREALLAQIETANYSIKKEMKKEMQKRVEMCAKENIQAELQVTVGNAAHEILRVVKENSIDLIVMAKRRKLKGVKSLLTLGSVSRKIVENTNCPVLIIDIEKI